jgi:DNA-binding GntR family transcriptional regulator
MSAEPRRQRSRDSDAVEHATTTLRNRIVSGEIAPGAELPQVGLAEQLGISTTPLREALRQLEAEGLIESRRNRRPRVPPFDPEDLDSIYANRILIESLAVSLAVPDMTIAELAQLRGLLDAMAALASDPDIGRWEIPHVAFHRALVARCSEPLRHQIDGMLNRSQRYRRMSVLGTEPSGRGGMGAQEHEAILVACTDREPREAGVLLARHLTRSALSLMAQLAPDFDPIATRSALQMVMSWAGQPALATL